MTGTSGDATTWRDIADQLTPDQIAELEGFEERTGLAPDILLFFARRDAAGNLRHSVEFGQIDPPPDAVRCFGWQRGEEGGDVWSREFWGELTQPGDANVIVSVTGRQFNDEHCERRVAIVGRGTGWLTADQTRELARLMIEAADRIDALNY